VFHCVSTPGQAWVGDHDTSAVMISDDGGATWRERPVPDSVGCVHMNVHPLAGGTLLALFRSRWADHVYRSTSTDDGWTWSAPTPTVLPNNNSSLQYVPLRDGSLALVYNHSSKENATGRRASLYDEISDDGVAGVAGVAEAQAEATGAAFWGAPRAPMTLALSKDDGQTWHGRNLEEGDGHCLTNNSRDKLNRELSYPSIIQTPDETLHIAYTHFRQAIRYVRVDPAWITR
jgi:predicted neuraminidase